MGCGQSKINLYPRKNKNGSKGNSAKKAGATEKDADEEEGNSGQSAAASDDEEDPERGKNVLPLVSHLPTIEISASQLDFFKMLDEKIESGKDYDSSSETEVRLERDRRRVLVDQWRSASQSTQSLHSQSDPPTPARKRVARPLPIPPDRSSPKRCFRQHISDNMSPSSRRMNAPVNQVDNRLINGENKLKEEADKASIRKPQSVNWKNNYKIPPHSQKAKKESEECKNKDYSNSEGSQVTFNPTFQSHSPAHSAKGQPYVAQIMTYPTSQQITPPTTPKYIAPPEEYQDKEEPVESKKTSPKELDHSPQPIYYIHGNSQDIVQQRQQTALHLQQYVAMKQAQMYTYYQKSPHTVFPNTEVQVDPNVYYQEECQYRHTGGRPHSAPTPVGVVRPLTIGFGQGDSAHMPHMPVWSPLPAVVSNATSWNQDLQYYPQSQFMQMYRPNSAGSAGTLTRYQRRDDVQKNVCQSINIVRQKPVGQIAVGGGQELTVCATSSESPSPASVSTDSGVSPGNSLPNSKNFVFTPNAKESVTTTENKNKKKKVPSNRSLKNSRSLDSS